MKRLLCVLLITILLIISATSGVSALAPGTEPYETNLKYRDLFYTNLGIDIPEKDSEENSEYRYNFISQYNEDGRVSYDGEMPDYILGFITKKEVTDSICTDVFGDYVVTVYKTYSPYELGYYIYSANEDKLYTLREAWDSGLGKVEFALGIVGCKVGAENKDYYSKMNEYLSKYTYESSAGNTFIHDFGMEIAYKHYSDDALTPDYVVAFVESTATRTKCYYEIDGYYIYGYFAPHYDSHLTYFVIDGKTMEVMPWAEALEQDYDMYSAFLTESDYDKITRIGDVDRDEIITIKDATAIQKCIAGLENFESQYDDTILGFQEKMYGKWERYVSDFDRDGERNVKDATAIQKCVAGLPY